MVQLCPLEDPEEVAEVQALLLKFSEYTGSERGTRFVRHWDEFGPKFVKVYPNDYRRVIETQRRFRLEGLGEAEAEMAAFEENAHDLARVGGK
jgi:glutamate synthase (ferredoxin)